MMNSGNKTILHLARMNNKKNKSRSILVFLVIFLSTILLTAIMSYGFGIVKFEKMSSEEQYGRFTGMLSDITDEDLAITQKDDNFTEIGLLHSCGFVESDANISLKALDEMARDLSCMQRRITSGSYPEKVDEILVSEGLLRACGLENLEIGDTISLSVRLNYSLPYKPMDFTISGFYKDGGESADAYNAFVSEEFYEKYARDYEDDFSVLFNMTEDMNLDFENAEDILKEYVASLGLRESQVSVNSMYILLVLNPGKEVLLTCIFLVLLVVLFSMIVIYNIFQISLVQRMQEYGRLKALGTTRSQIKKLINWEGILIALPAIPLGALSGYLLSTVTFSWVISTVNNLQSRNISHFNMFSPVAVLGSALIAFLTVWLALAGPKRKIARISAIEAMDFRESTDTSGGRKSREKSGSGMRKGLESVNEFSLALANLAANKKQTLTTMLTMGLSCVLLVVVMNCIGNIDTEYEARKEVPHGQFEISLDYTFYDTVYPEDNLDVILSDNPLNQEFMEALKDISGVTDVTARDYLVIERNGGQKEAVNVLSREDLDFERDKGGAKGVIDYDLASKEDQIFFGWSHFMGDDGIEMGPVDYSLWNGRESKSFHSEVAGSFGSLTGGWAITEDTYRHFGFENGSSIGKVWVDCSPDNRASVESAIRELMSNWKHLELETFEHNYQEQQFGTRVIRWSLYSLLIMIAFIGFMNMVNTMIISITTRRREYGIMQAVGMTGKQLNRSLTFQGLIYTGGTLLISLIVGIPMGYLAFAKFKSIAGFGMNVYHFPMVEIVSMTAVMLMMQLVLSWVLSRNVKRDSLVERIRY